MGSDIHKSTRSEKMNKGKKSRKLLLITTVLTIVALAVVLSVYAVVQLGIINGGTVTVGGVTTGTISYNINNSTSWSTTDPQPSGSWYAQLAINSGYAGPVTITFQLQTDASGGWANVNSATVTTNTIVLTGSGQNVYASTIGTQTSNQDWSTYATTAGAYRVTATINSAS